ncbi:MAG: alpha-glucosidase [Clostridia bacterium]|nr:alpha-glucosidase [Clostridia bacterium]
MGDWWKDRVAYQIYPRSFQDSNGDGIGDIPGIISRLDYLKALGAGIIWLSPVYRSPNEDNGYDISDYKDINPEFGTMDDMKALINEAAKRDIRIIMDLVINHTSTSHSWFQQSRDKNSPYRNYYFWRPGRENGPPNNWTSFFAEDCWEFDKKSGEYYLHLFAKGQPDLDYHNPAVIEEIKDIMRFWLDMGIAGFRCDVINIIWKSSLEDGRKKLALTGSEHYISQEGMHEILRKLRLDVLDGYDCFTVGETVFVTTRTANDLCAVERRELDMVFSFEHMETDQFFVKWFPRKFNPGRFCKTIARWQQALEWNANYFENHDQPRSISRFGNEGEYHGASAKMLGALLLTLRGTPFIYQGQEIGMTNYKFKKMEQIKDVESHNLWKKAKVMHIPKWYRWKMILRGCRDHARTPVQWDSSEFGGFSKHMPWLAPNGNYTYINVETQRNDNDSILNFYKQMILLRTSDDVIKYGSFEPVVISKRLFVYKRKLDGRTMTIALNFSGRLVKFYCAGNLLISNYARETYDGRLKPYEAIVFDEDGKAL